VQSCRAQGRVHTSFQGGGMKAILVSKCEQCPYYSTTPHVAGPGPAYCSEAHQHFVNPGAIPDWCPLDNAQQEPPARRFCHTCIHEAECNGARAKCRGYVPDEGGTP